MKDIIVLISTVVLGIALAAMVVSFKGSAKNLTDAAGGQINSLAQQVSGAAFELDLD